MTDYKKVLLKRTTFNRKKGLIKGSFITQSTTFNYEFKKGKFIRVQYFYSSATPFEMSWQSDFNTRKNQNKSKNFKKSLISSKPWGASFDRVYKTQDRFIVDTISLGNEEIVKSSIPYFNSDKQAHKYFYCIYRNGYFKFKVTKNKRKVTFKSFIIPNHNDKIAPFLANNAYYTTFFL